MSSRWFYRSGEEKLGPISSQQLRQLAEEGTIEPMTLVWRQGIDSWVKAQQVKGLFSTAPDCHVAALSGIGKRTPPASNESEESSQSKPPPLPVQPTHPSLSQVDESGVASSSPRRVALVNCLVALTCVAGLGVVAVLIVAVLNQQNDDLDGITDTQVKQNPNGNDRHASISPSKTEEGKSEGNRKTDDLVARVRNPDRVVSTGSSGSLAPPEGETPRPLIRTVDVGEYLDCVQFSPDSRFLAAGVWGTGGSGDDVKLIDVRTGTVTKTLQGLGSRAVAFSPDGSMIAAGGRPKVVVIWDVKSGKPRKILRGHNGPIESLAFDTTGQKLASCSHGQVKIWDVASGRETISIECDMYRTQPVVQFNPRNNSLIFTRFRELGIVADDGTTRSWEVGTMSSLSITPNGKLLALGTDIPALGWSSTPIRLWDLTSETFVGNCGQQWKDERVTSFHPDGELLASGTTNKSIALKVWHVKTGHAVYWHDFERDYTVDALDFAPNGTLLATGSNYAEVRFWDVAAMRKVHELREKLERSEENKRDRAQLEGIWTGAHWNAHTGWGRPKGTEGQIAFEFKGSKVRFGDIGEIVSNEVDLWFTYTLDALASPKQIDIVRDSDGIQSPFLRGYYRFESDALRLHYSTARPSTFPDANRQTEDGDTAFLKRFATLE